MRSKGIIAFAVLLLVFGAGGCSAVSSYNNLVAQEERVATAWANVETQYQRRADLIPNLVSTVQGAADFESETLTEVTEARARATSVQIDPSDLDDPQKLRQYQEAQSALSQSLGRLLAVSENYPQLQATQAFRDLQAQLEGTENRITVARRDYNEVVRRYNTEIRSFPTNLMAGITGFDRRAPFEADAGASEAPSVEFN